MFGGKYNRRGVTSILRHAEGNLSKWIAAFRSVETPDVVIWMSRPPLLNFSISLVIILLTSTIVMVMRLVNYQDRYYILTLLQTYIINWNN